MTPLYTYWKILRKVCSLNCSKTLLTKSVHCVSQQNDICKFVTCRKITFIRTILCIYAADLSHIASYIIYYIFTHTACDGTDCPRGPQCKIDQATRQMYCEASCDLDNGGCADIQKCTLINNTCTSNLCNDLPVPECSTGG